MSKRRISMVQFSKQDKKSFLTKVLNIVILCLVLSFAHNIVFSTLLTDDIAYAATSTYLEKQLKYININMLYISQECEELSRFESKFKKPILDVHPMNLDSDGNLRKELIDFALDNKYRVKIISCQYVPNSFDPATNTVMVDLFERIEFEVKDTVPIAQQKDNVQKNYEEYFWRYTYKLPNNKNEVPKALNRTKRTTNIIEKQVTSVATVRFDAKLTRWAGFRDSAGTGSLKKGEKVLITLDTYNDDLKSAYCLIYDDKRDEILGWVEKYELQNIQSIK